jgi:hypothetical protein
MQDASPSAQADFGNDGQLKVETGNGGASPSKCQDFLTAPICLSAGSMLHMPDLGSARREASEPM